MTSYNKKIVRTSSYIEIWEYEKPIFSKGKSILDTNTENKEKTKRRTFDELTPEEQEQRLERMKKTRLEAKWNLLRLVDCNFDDETSFLTLTTKKNISDRNHFKDLLKTFIKRFNYHIFNTKKSKLKYLAVLVRINKVDVDSKENRGRYVTKYFEKGIGQELLENFGKQAYLSSRNLKKPDEDKFYTYEIFDYNNSTVLYETEYSSKVYKDGQYFDNHVKYKKIKLDE